MPRPTRTVTFQPGDALREAMDRLKQERGIPVSEQIRRALVAWLTREGAIKAERKRAGTRKRP